MSCIEQSYTDDLARAAWTSGRFQEADDATSVHQLWLSVVTNAYTTWAQSLFCLYRILKKQCIFLLKFNKFKMERRRKVSTLYVTICLIEKRKKEKH